MNREEYLSDLHALAASWHGGQWSALYAVSCGTCDEDRAYLTGALSEVQRFARTERKESRPTTRKGRAERAERLEELCELAMQLAERLARLSTVQEDAADIVEALRA
jgi:hypothetical protein